ncbi:MAG: hypothetical protein A2X56_10150 [Nitrospirae bacterium GWC2_57_13]|nr:MAG: hypothetical protein A2072_07610 [Nitrospirae bacterium GWC1_57_7]OGW26733.1 MAG: hypothetical protein A2X56_10150 [Nitrospirae bacterium GWC2_57_13]OGW46516.1 MAG: hypothetical protein A2X57_01865 [Nitrospirae bacterium GWD2_57_8]HAS54482.1 CAP domain-containing protein [Nitrospiraceae bacterium]
MNNLSRKFAPMLLTTVALLFVTACVPQPSRVPAGSVRPEHKPQPKVSAPDLEQRVHALINKERQGKGLSTLAWDERLSRIARKHSEDMAKRRYFSHDSPEGHGFSARYSDAGYVCAVRDGRYIYTGAENIFQNNLFDRIITMNNVKYYDWNKPEEIAETTVKGWMNSTGHRKNILTPQWGKEGIGVYITPDGKVFITQNFC